MSEFKRWQILGKLDIPDPGGRLYLRRWRLVQTPWFGIYLHKIMQHDGDRDMHDHPWPFVSVVLLGGYDELLVTDDRTDLESCPVETRRRGWLSLAFRPSRAIHRITRLWRVPTWTLVMVGKKDRSWGFHTAEGFVHWREYNAKKAAR